MKGTIIKLFKNYFLLDFRDCGLADNSWRMKIGVARNRYEQGNGMVNTFKDVIMILGIGGILTGIKLDFEFYYFIIMGIIWVVACYSLGFWNEIWGFWAQQNIHATQGKGIQPVFREMLEKLNKIENKINGK